MDECGTCFAFANASHWNQACAGCDGVANSGKKKDECGVCAGPGVDKCGTCLPIGDKNRIEKGSLRNCSDREGFTPTTPEVESGFPVWAIVFIVVVILVGAAIGVTVAVRYREAKIRAGVDDILKQYLPMDQKGDAGVGHPTANARVAINAGNLESDI